MATVARVLVLLWVDILAVYAMYVMMAYLTDVWELGFTHAAAIVNVFWGVTLVLPLFLAYLADTIMGHYWVLLISSFAYSAGLGFLALSTPPVLANATGTCNEYSPECIGQVQRVLVYAGLPLIALGMSGHLTSWNSFMAEQLNGEGNNLDEGTFWRFFYSVLAVIVLTIVATFGLPYISPWSVRFGIPAICTLIATLLFLTGSCSYKYFKPEGSPLTVFVRVFVVATSKFCYQTPRDTNELFELQSDERYYAVPHTKSLRCLDKAAIVIPTKPIEEQEHLWKLCTVTEVEETKIIIRMIPVWFTFILCGVVSSIGLTYFIEQLDSLNPRVGRLRVPTVVLLWFYEQSQNFFAKLYATLANFLGESWSKKYAPPIGIMISMILAILCCITAASVETRRLSIVQEHGLVDRPDERVPMTMFWMLPQYILLGAFMGVFNYSSISFFVDQSPVATRRYFPFFMTALVGVGNLGSVLSVFVVGKVSERGGGMNWFQKNLNGSRVDKYYWTLGWLMAVNLVVYILVAVFYRYKESELKDQDGVEFGGINEPFDESAKGLCCCC